MGLVRIHVCQSMPEAAVLGTKFAASGIPACFQGANHAYVAWHHLFAIGGIPILVPAEEAQKAQDLISACADTQIPLRESTLCSEAPIRNGLISGIALILFGVIFPIWVRKINQNDNSQK